MINLFPITRPPRAASSMRMLGRSGSAEDLEVPGRREQFSVLHPAEHTLLVGHEHGDALASLVLEGKADSIRLLSLPRWNRSNVVTNPGRPNFPVKRLLAKRLSEEID